MPTETRVLAERFALRGLIGRGGMADVYRGVDLLLDRDVAVKLMRDVTATESERRRFVSEARTLASLSHPGLVTLLDAGADGRQPYLVMELVNGLSLADRCASAGLDATRVAAIGRQVAAALAYVHATGVIHRDVKPANILTADDGRAWLTDFGVAKLLGDATAHTSTGLVVGTAAYLSPEQLRGEELTPATDVYSLGLVLIEALTGERVYPGPVVERVHARLSEGPPMPEAIPPSWTPLLAAMTSLDPSRRPGADEVSQRLGELGRQDGDSPPATASDGATTAPTAPLDPVSATRVMSGPALPTAPVLEERRALIGPIRALVVAIGAAVVLLLGGLAIAQLTPDNAGTGQDDRLPANVPPRLEQPLRDLHDAVNGGGQ